MPKLKELEPALGPTAKRKKKFTTLLCESGICILEAQRAWTMLGVTQQHSPVKSANKVLELAKRSKTTGAKP